MEEFKHICRYCAMSLEYTDVVVKVADSQLLRDYMRDLLDSIGRSPWILPLPCCDQATIVSLVVYRVPTKTLQLYAQFVVELRSVRWVGDISFTTAFSYIAVGRVPGFAVVLVQEVRSLGPLVYDLAATVGRTTVFVRFDDSWLWRTLSSNLS